MMKVPLKIGVWLVGAALAVLCGACAGQPAVPGPGPLSFDLVRGKDWQLAELKAGADLVFSREGGEFDAAYTLKFQNGMASGRGAPNTYRAPFEEGPGQGLSIKGGAATLMAPLRKPEGFTESQYFGYLERVYRWDLKDGSLELSTRGEDGAGAVLVYRPAQP